MLLSTHAVVFNATVDSILGTSPSHRCHGTGYSRLAVGRVPQARIRRGGIRAVSALQFWEADERGHLSFSLPGHCEPWPAQPILATTRRRPAPSPAVASRLALHAH